MANKTIMEKQLLYMEFLNRENDLQNFYYDEAVLQYELLRVGNPKAVKEGRKQAFLSGYERTPVQ